MEKLKKRIETSLQRLEYEVMRAENVDIEIKMKTFIMLKEWKKMLNENKEGKEVKDEMAIMGEMDSRNSGNDNTNTRQDTKEKRK